MSVNISKILRDRNLSADISPKELFLSKNFRDYVGKMSEGITERYTDPPTVSTSDEGDRGTIAYTDGNKVSLNATNSLVARAKTMFDKFVVMLGISFHEFAHIIFTNFELENALTDGIMNDGKLPVSADFQCQNEDAMNEVVSKLGEHAAWRKFFAEQCHKLSNFAADNHDEEALIASYRWSSRDGRPSLIEECIYAARRTLREGESSVEEKLEQENGSITYKLMMSLLFSYIRYGQLIYADPQNPITDIEQAFAPFKEDAQLIATTDSVSEKFDGITRIMLTLWPYIKAQLPEDENSDDSNDQDDQEQEGEQGEGDGSGQQTGDGQNEGGESEGDDASAGGQNQPDGDTSQEENGTPCGGGQSPSSETGENAPGRGSQGSGDPIENLLNDLRNAAEKSGETQQPQNRQNSDGAMPSTPQQNAQGENQAHGRAVDKPRSDNSPVLETALRSLLNSLAQGKGEEMADAVLSEELANAILEQNASGPHSRCKVNRIRLGEPSSKAISDYEVAHRETVSYSKRLARMVEQIFVDAELGRNVRHKDFGRSFDVRDAYRPDQRFFCQKKQPEDRPRIAVTLLLDRSGSMRGRRIDASKKAAVMLYDFCMELNIPCMVCGHDAESDWAEWSFYTATLFDTVSRTDKYRIMDMDTGNCNRDGAAIQVAQGILGKRSEDIKLCFVINDGKPNAYRYGGLDARDDIKQILAKNRRKHGIETFALSIGEDKEAVRQIYEEGYINIDDLSTLPTALVKVLKKRLIQNR